MKTPRALYLGLATAASATGAAPRSAAARAAAQSGAEHARAARSARAHRTRSGQRVAFSASPLLVVQLSAWRSKFALFLLFCAFVALALRAFWLQGGVNTRFLLKQGEARYARTLDVPATRGRVLDRHGAVLAGSVAARSVWAIPDDVDAPVAQLAALAQALQMPLAELKRKLANDDRTFVYLRRQVEPEVWAGIERLGLAGIHSSSESRRQYPEGATAAQVVGFTSVEDRGQDGVELALESSLAGADGRRRVIKDRLGRVVDDDWLREPRDGRDVALAIDSAAQYIAFAAVRNAAMQNDAQAGAAIVLDVHTGEILALANWPSFEPNARGGERNAWRGEALRNRALADMFEPGSTLKPFSIAAALEAGVVTPQTMIQTAPGRLTIGNRTIGDSHPHGLLTVEQVVAKSSNVGTAKISLELPAKALWDTYTGAGFGLSPQGQGREVGITNAVPGRLRPYRSWRPIEQATIAYGYGVSVSLLQLARAYTVFARDGELLPLSLVKTGTAASGEKLLSTETARAMRAMLELAVQPGGTGPRARIMGWRVAGKTGTAHKQENGGYAPDKFVASFVGFAPASAPRVVVAVMIDEPSAGEHYGGIVAAPVFAQVTQGALRMMGVPHDAPLEPLETPAEGEEAKENT